MQSIISYIINASKWVNRKYNNILVENLKIRNEKKAELLNKLSRNLIPSHKSRQRRT